jgi:hypothetical protein
MREELARAILKILGIMTALVGSILTSQALFGWLAIPKDQSGSGLGTYVSVEGMVGSVARTAITQNLLVVLFGCLLCALSPALARFVAGKMPPNQPQELPSRDQRNRES